MQFLTSVKGNSLQLAWTVLVKTTSKMNDVNDVIQKNDGSTKVVILIGLNNILQGKHCVL